MGTDAPTSFDAGTVFVNAKISPKSLKLIRRRMAREGALALLLTDSRTTYTRPHPHSIVEVYSLEGAWFAQFTEPEMKPAQFQGREQAERWAERTINGALCR